MKYNFINVMLLTIWFQLLQITYILKKKQNNEQQ